MPRTKATEQDKAVAAATAPGAGKAPGKPKRRKWKSGTVVRRDIKRLQMGADATKRLIPRAAMRRLIKEVVQNMGGGSVRTTSSAVMALHDGVEPFLVEVFQLANRLAHQLGGREGVNIRDYQVAAGLIAAKNCGEAF